ncbi:MAG: heparinase II/III domain-containing protein [Acidimicrobiales bacterium]
MPSSPGWPGAYLALDARAGAQGFPSAEANADGRFSFLGEQRSLGDPPDWEQSDADQLWRYHLGYFDWAWAFVAHPHRSWARAAFARLWRSWADRTTFGRGDAWSPYVVSLRSWALCGLYRPLVHGGSDDESFRHQIGLHAGFVRASLEFDVGGNHLVKNLKALVGLGVFLDDEDLLRLARYHLQRQISVQVLDDGGHFELSPSYHCQVLGDLVDISDLLELAQRPPIEGLAPAIEAMRRWLGLVRMPDGDVPLFNDCGLVGEHRLKLLKPAPAPRRRLVVLGPSGYVVMRPDERLHLVADVGAPCPRRLPAHAHADCLSFELAVDGRRVIVNSGTSTYQPGSRRHYERSTRAHNTVELDGEDQTEMWGTFRAARRAGPVLEGVADDAEVVEVVASHDGYRRLPGRPGHRRTWRVGAASIEIIDDISGCGVHDVVSSIHLAAGTTVVPIAGGFRAGRLSATATEGATLRIRHPSAVGESKVSSGFGPTQPNTTLEVVARARLPVRQTLRLVLEPLAEGEGPRPPRGPLGSGTT